ncbi:hypothetical protein GGR52DRAFT_584795 [Hypoxylon sp. FL1284]|nr:hypothetical protein GGR52DRAFT_584795 [Hypoxylon sp. FL1284]
MCLIRRIYFSCKHEDRNVTPPRPMTPCILAHLKGSFESPHYCPLTDPKCVMSKNKEDDIYRDWPCVRCEEKELKRKLDKVWNDFVVENIPKVSVSEMFFYMTERDKIFDRKIHHRNWEMMQDTLIGICKWDIEEKYGYK